MSSDCALNPKFCNYSGARPLGPGGVTIVAFISNSTARSHPARRCTVCSGAAGPPALQRQLTPPGLVVVYFMYCDGSSFTGNRELPHAVDGSKFKGVTKVRAQHLYARAQTRCLGLAWVLQRLLCPGLEPGRAQPPRTLGPDARPGKGPCFPLGSGWGSRFQ